MSYSDRARDAWMEAMRGGETDFSAVVAMHDREAFGLDASVCARSFLEEIAETLINADPNLVMVDTEEHPGDFLRRESGASHDR